MEDKIKELEDKISNVELKIQKEKDKFWKKWTKPIIIVFYIVVVFVGAKYVISSYYEIKNQNCCEIEKNYAVEKAKMETKINCLEKNIEILNMKLNQPLLKQPLKNQPQAPDCNKSKI